MTKRGRERGGEPPAVELDPLGASVGTQDPALLEEEPPPPDETDPTSPV